VIVFALINLVPSDPVVAQLGIRESQNPAIVKAFKERFGLDKPVPVQYLLFLDRLARGDLGKSEQTGRPVLTDLADYVPATVELAISSTALAIVFGVTLGTLAATHHNKPIDHLLRVVSLSGTSVASFWLGLLALYVFFYKLGWFPNGGRLDPGANPPPQVTGLYTVDSLLVGDFGTLLSAIQHLVLPAAVLAAPFIGQLIRFSRTAVLEVAREEYITVARAKGLSPISVLRHVLRAAFPPIATVIGFLFADVLTGTILIETIFSWPGVGRYAFHAATTLDLPAMTGVTLFVTSVFLVVNLVVDTLYGVIDPRLRIA
jgi:peptide/nickel transport system permease protein